MHRAAFLRVCLFSLLVSLCAQAIACLDIDFNERLYHPHDRFRNEVGDPGGAYRAELADVDFEESFLNWKKRCERDGRLKDCKRYAVCLALKGDLDGALAKLLVIEADFPGMYATAVSIASLYEFKGEYDEALTWMQKALKLEPRGHNGAENIHINILRVESAGEQATCTSQELIGYDFGTDSIPRSRLSIEDLDTLQAKLFLILDQREFFRNGKKDPVAARLAFELGNLYFLRGCPTVSLKSYEFAKELGFKDPLVEMRMASVLTSDYKPPVRVKDVKTMEKIMQQLTHPEEEAERRSKYTASLLFVSVLLFLAVAVVVGAVLYRHFERRSHPAPIKRDRFDDLFRDDD